MRDLGFDCATCRKAHARIDALVALYQAEARVEKVDDPRELPAHRVMAPNGIVIGGQLAHAGGRSSQHQIEKRLAVA